MSSAKDSTEDRKNDTDSDDAIAARLAALATAYEAMQRHAPKKDEPKAPKK